MSFSNVATLWTPPFMLPLPCRGSRVPSPRCWAVWGISAHAVQGNNGMQLLRPDHKRSHVSSCLVLMDSLPQCLAAVLEGSLTTSSMESHTLRLHPAALAATPAGKDLRGWYTEAISSDLSRHSCLASWGLQSISFTE